MNAYTKLSHDFAALSRNLTDIEKERRERDLRLAARRQELLQENLRQTKERLVQKALWWVSPASWSVVFVAGFFMTDWLLGKIDNLLGYMGL